MDSRCVAVHSLKFFEYLLDMHVDVIIIIYMIGDVFQAEDRVRRIGQRSPTVTSIWISGFIIDEKLDKLLQSKDKSCQLVLNHSSTNGVPSAVISNKNWFQESKGDEIDTKIKGSTANSKQCAVPITKYFTAQYPNIYPNSIAAADSNKDFITNTCSIQQWNVTDSEEEQEITTKSIMSDLLSAIL